MFLLHTIIPLLKYLCVYKKTKTKQQLQLCTLAYNAVSDKLKGKTFCAARATAHDSPNCKLARRQHMRAPGTPI